MALNFSESPVPQSASVSVTEEKEAAAALLALMGCLTCGRPFSNKTNHVFVCCNVAYCPYCASPGTKKCRHLVAAERHGHCSIPGVVRKKTVNLPPLSNNSGCPLKFNSRNVVQRRSPTLQKLVVKLFGESIDKLPCDNDVIRGLIDISLKPDYVVEAGGSGRQRYRYFFARDREAALAQVRDDLHDRFASLIPPAPR